MGRAVRRGVEGAMGGEGSVSVWGVCEDGGGAVSVEWFVGVGRVWVSGLWRGGGNVGEAVRCGVEGPMGGRGSVGGEGEDWGGGLSMEWSVGVRGGSGRGFCGGEVWAGGLCGVGSVGEGICGWGGVCGGGGRDPMGVGLRWGSVDVVGGSVGVEGSWGMGGSVGISGGELCVGSVGVGGGCAGGGGAVGVGSGYRKGSVRYGAGGAVGVASGLWPCGGGGGLWAEGRGSGGAVGPFGCAAPCVRPPFRRRSRR